MPAELGALVVCAVVRRENKVLLVREGESDNVRWGLPGGMVDPGELLHEALVREVREETGLEVHALGSVALVSQHYHPDHPNSLMQLTFEVSDFTGEPVTNDPDGLVHEARFFEIADAVAALQEGTAGPWSIPHAQYLLGNVPPASAWLWRLADSVSEPVAILPE